MQAGKKIAPILIILILCFIAYSNTFHANLHYDDSTNIIRNKNVHLTEITWDNIVKTWFAGGERGDIYHPILYRPVAMFSFAVNYYFGKLDPFGYHVVNLLIFFITIVFVFFLIKDLLILSGRETNSIPIAFLATAFWALNPIQLTSVTYVTQRMTSMAGLFYAIALYCYIKARTENKRFYILSGLSILMGIGTKENVIMAPVAILIMELLFFGGFSKRKWAIILWVGLGCLLMLYAVQGTDSFSYEKLMKGFAKRDFTLGQRLLTEPRVILFYFMLIFFPHHSMLSLTHPIKMSTGLFSPVETLISILSIVLIVGVAIWKAREYRLFSFCVLFFFLNHVIEGTIIPLELIYEHRNFVPTMFVFIPIAFGLVRLYERNKRVLVVCAVSVIMVFLSYNTFVQNAVWKKDLSLWMDVNKKGPDPRSMFNLAGAYYQEVGSNEMALKYWTASARFNDIYGTDYDENPRIIPYGRVMYMATHNAMMLKMVKDAKVRHGWAIKGDISQMAEIKEN